jgi:hypothetical protein
MPWVSPCEKVGRFIEGPPREGKRKIRKISSFRGPWEFKLHFDAARLPALRLPEARQVILKTGADEINQ